MPDSQLVNRLQDLHYRVQSVAEAGRLSDYARREGPMLVLADLSSSRADVGAAIARLKQDPATAHIPVIAFADEGADAL